MKKLSLSLVLLAGMLMANAQTRTDSLPAKFKGNNEIKLNILYTVIGYPSLAYERILSNNWSVGIIAFATVNKSSDLRQELTPGIRYYVAGRKANGFFLEGDMPILNRRDFSKGTGVSSGIRTSYGLAGVIGLKFLTKAGYVGELYLGGGKLLGDFDGSRPKSTGFLAGIDEMYVKFGIALGKRF